MNGASVAGQEVNCSQIVTGYETFPIGNQALVESLKLVKVVSNKFHTNGSMFERFIVIISKCIY